MSTPDTPGTGTGSEVAATVSKLGESAKGALEKLSKSQLAAALEAHRKKLEADQRRIFSQAVKSHIADANGKPPKKLTFKFDPKKQLWSPAPDGLDGFIFVVSKKGNLVTVPKALSLAVGVPLPGGWKWESKSTQSAPDYDTASYEEALKKHEDERQKKLAEKAKETYSTKGGYAFESGSGGDIYLRIGESTDSFLLKVKVDSAGTFRQRGKVLFLELGGLNYRVARKSPRTYYETMEAYARDADVQVPSGVTKVSNITLALPDNRFELVAPVLDTQFWGLDVVRQRTDDNPENDIYQVEPAGTLFEQILRSDGRPCQVSDRPDFVAETCNGGTLYLHQTGFSRRPGGVPPVLVTGAAARHERRRWAVARRFGLESQHVNTSSGQLHCFATRWQGIRIHYSINFAAVDADDNFDLALGHLTLELGTWEQGNGKFFRYYFNTRGLTRPDPGPNRQYAYEQYCLATSTTPAMTQFVADVSAGVTGAGLAFRQRMNF